MTVNSKLNGMTMVAYFNYIQLQLLNTTLDLIDLKRNKIKMKTKQTERKIYDIKINSVNLNLSKNLLCFYFL